MGTLLGVRDDPDIARMAIRGAESYGAVGIDGHCEAAGHRLITGRCAGDKETNGEGA